MNKEIEISLISPIYILSQSMVKMTKKMIEDINNTRIKNTEFIIVDNNSTVGVDEMRDGSDIYIRLESNRGWGGGLNAGMKIAKGKYFAFINNDITITDKEWCQGVIKRFENVPKTGAISVNSRAGFSGALFLIRREIYDLIGGFDEENFPLGHAQDCDYLYRLIKEGWGIYVYQTPDYQHFCRRTYNQVEFKNKYLSHHNFSKSDFQGKWGFKAGEWLAKGNEAWTKKIQKNPKLDRFNEL